MDIYFTERSKKDFSKLSIEAQKAFTRIFEMISNREELPGSAVKKINSDLYEIRIRTGSGIYRGIGGYTRRSFVVVLFFKKKTKKLPKSIMETAQKRFYNWSYEA